VCRPASAQRARLAAHRRDAGPGKRRRCSCRGGKRPRSGGYRLDRAVTAQVSRKVGPLGDQARGELKKAPSRLIHPEYATYSDDNLPALINGAAGFVGYLNGQLFSIAAVTVRSGKIVELDFFNDPNRLRLIDLTILDD
jgi:hypothetical protein